MHGGFLEDFRWGAQGRFLRSSSWWKYVQNILHISWYLVSIWNQTSPPPPPSSCQVISSHNSRKISVHIWIFFKEMDVDQAPKNTVVQNLLHGIIMWGNKCLLLQVQKPGFMEDECLSLRPFSSPQFLLTDQIVQMLRPLLGTSE